MGRGPATTVGDRAEQAAFRYLVDQGLRPLARNFRCRGGEIDLIMLDGPCLVFIEVRYRRSTQFTTPDVTVDFRKQRKIIRSAAMFNARHHDYTNYPMRFDVVAIAGEKPPSIKWIRDAFRPTDSVL